MNSHFYFCGLFSFAIFFQIFCAKAFAADHNWQNLDAHLYSSIYCLNVGIDVRLKDGPWVQLSGISPRQHYYVFTTTSQEQGYQIVGHGTSFPLASTDKQKLVFITCKHVLDDAAETIRECEMFYSAMRLYAVKTAKNNESENRMDELLNIVNLSLKKNLTATEKILYAKTVDAIWDCYDTNLSIKADPKQLLFGKYKKLVSLQTKTAYLLHSPGSLTQPALQAKIYKVSTTPDLAILTIQSSYKQTVSALDLDETLVNRGQEVQAAGYPVLTESKNPIKSYSPTFTNGKVLYADTNTVGFDASINKGSSGGPLLSKNGKVLGIIIRKPDLRKRNKSSDLYCNIAVSSRAVRSFVPELFKAL